MQNLTDFTPASTSRLPDWQRRRLASMLDSAIHLVVDNVDADDPTVEQPLRYHLCCALELAGGGN